MFLTLLQNVSSLLNSFSIIEVLKFVFLLIGIFFWTKYKLKNMEEKQKALEDKVEEMDKSHNGLKESLDKLNIVAQKLESLTKPLEIWQQQLLVETLNNKKNTQT